MLPPGLPDGNLRRRRGGVAPVGQRHEVDLAPLAARTNRLGVTQKSAAQVTASGKVSDSGRRAAPQYHWRVQGITPWHHCPPTPGSSRIVLRTWHAEGVQLRCSRRTGGVHCGRRPSAAADPFLRLVRASHMIPLCFASRGSVGRRRNWSCAGTVTSVRYMSVHLRTPPTNLLIT